MMEATGTPSEAAVAVKNLIRRVNAQVHDDQATTRAEIETLSEEIRRLEDIKRTNAVLISDLCHAVSADSDRCIAEVQTEADRTLYDLAYNKDGTEKTAQDPFEPIQKNELDQQPAAITRKSATPSFEKPRSRRPKRSKKDDEKDALRKQYEKHGYFPDQRYKHEGEDGKSKKDYISDWLHSFAWKRQLEYSYVHRKLDTEGLLETSGEETALLDQSPSSRHHSVHLHASGRHSSSHHASKQAAAKQQKNSSLEAILRAKLAVVEAERVAAALHSATFRYCEGICRRVNLLTPVDDVANTDDEVFSLFGNIEDNRSHEEGVGSEAVPASLPPRRKDGRKMSSMDVLSMEGRLMPSVVEERGSDEDEEEEDMIIYRSNPDNDRQLDESEKENNDTSGYPRAQVPTFTGTNDEDLVRSARRVLQGDVENGASKTESSEGELEHVASTYPTRGTAGMKGSSLGQSATALESSMLHDAISDVYQWIKYKEIATLLAASSNSSHPAAPEYLTRHVDAVIDNANATKALERKLKEVRRRKCTERIDRAEKRASVADHVMKTAGLFLQPDKDGKQKVLGHHWNEVAAKLGDNAKYNVSGISAIAATESDALAIAMREEQRMARKTRVNELSKQLRDRQMGPPKQTNGPSTATSVSSAPLSAVMSVAEEDDEDDNEASSPKQPLATNQERKVSIVVNEGSRRSIMKGALVLKLEPKPDPEQEGASGSASQDSASDSSSSSSDDEFGIYDSSSSDEEEVDELAQRGALRGSTLYQKIVRSKTSQLKFLSEGYHKLHQNLFEQIACDFEGVEIKPMFGNPVSGGETVQFPLLLPGRNDYILCVREVLVGPVNTLLNIAVVYEPMRDRLVLEAIGKKQAVKFRIPLYQHDIDQIFPTRPSLKIFDFTSHMMNRYIDAVIRLLRIDRMIRRDAFTLSMKIKSVAHVPRPASGPIRPSTGGAAVLAPSRPRAATEEALTLSFADDLTPLEGSCICSLLPDGRPIRLRFVESVFPSRISSPPTKNVKAASQIEAIDHFPVDVNTIHFADTRPGSVSGPVSPRNHSVMLVKPPSSRIAGGALRLTPPPISMRDSSSLPEIKKKSSVMTVDVNYGRGIFVPLNRSSSLEIATSPERAPSAPSTPVVAHPTPRPPRDKGPTAGPLRPGSGARLKAPVKELSEAENVLGPVSLMKLVDTTAVLADRLYSPEVIKSPRRNLMGGNNGSEKTPRRKYMNISQKKRAYHKYSTLPTAGDIARTMREALKAKEKKEKGAMIGQGVTITPSALSSKADYLDTDEYNVDDVVLVMNLRREGDEAMLLLGGLNCHHESRWNAFL